MSSRDQAVTIGSTVKTSQRPLWVAFATTLLLINMMGGSCGTPATDPLNPGGDGQVLDDQPDNPSSDPSNPDNPPAGTLQLAIQASTSGGLAPLDVTFTAATLDGQALPDGTYAWDFDDSTTATGQQATHTYATAAAYTVTLSLTTAATGSNPIRATTTVTVTEPPPPPAQPEGVGADYDLTEDEPFQLTLAATQADDNTRFTLVTLPASGALSAPSGVGLASPTVTYTPAAGFAGDDAFTFAAYDASSAASAQSVSSHPPAAIHLCIHRKGILSVTPATNLSPAGTVGGPFTPASAVYTLSNVGGRNLNWKAAKAHTWLNFSKSSGTLAPGATDTVTVAVGSAANNLAAGSYSDTVSFTNTTYGRGNTTRSVSLTVNIAPGALTVTPSTDLTSTGTQGGPFSPAGAVYTLTNTGGQSLNWTAAKTQNWLTLSKSSGTLAAGATDTVTASIASAANGLSPATYTDTVTFTNTTVTASTPRHVSLIVSAPAGVLSVSPASGLTSSGTAGGPFSPANRAYTLTNTGGQSINWTAAKTKNWVALSKISGTLAAGATDTVTVSFGTAANSLAAGSYSDTVTFTNATNGSGNATRAVSLTVNAPAGALSVSPSGGLTSTGFQGGPFSPANRTYTLTNTGGQSINWTAAKTKSWVSLSKTSGTLAAGATDTVTVSFGTGANSLAVGSYSDTVTFTNTTNGTGNATRGVSLTVNSLAGTLTISPSGGFSSSGTQGGPFSPATIAYTLTNNGGQSLNWTAAKTQTWLSLSKTSGTLASGATDTVTVSFATTANSLAAGSYTDTVTFTNTTNGNGNGTRGVTLTVNPVAGVLAVSPAAGLTSSGTQGGPFTPSSIAYTLTNTGGSSIAWTAAKTQNWLSLSKTSGTLAAGATDTVTASLAAAASSLAVGSYSDTVTIANTTNGSGNTTRVVALTVNASPGALSVSPATGLTSSGAQGGPFSPTSTTYTLTNTGGQSVNWTAAKTTNWLTLSKSSGTLAAGATDTFSVSFSANANSLAAGSYSDTLTITNTTNGAGNTTRSVSLTVTATPGALAVTPATGLTSAGIQGGPFTPASVAYTLTNNGGTSLTWTAAKTQNWVNLSKTSGTLATGATDTVTVSIANAANGLAAGGYSDTVTFTNTTNGSGNTTRAVALTVNPPPGALSVSPAAGLSSSGPQGGPFSPTSTSYTLTNTGGQSINWTAAKTKNWVTLSKTSGSLAAGATDTVSVSLNNNANTLAVGNNTDTVTITNTTNGTGNTTRSVSLSVSTPPGALAISPSTGLTSSGMQGGPFSPASVTYTLSNTGGQSLTWTAAKTANWVGLSKTSSTLAAGATDTVVVSIGSAANSLTPGSYSDTVTFTNTTDGSGNATRAVALTVNAPPGAMSVSPITNLVSNGVQGGPFSPASATYTVTNTGGQYIAWSVTKTQTWLSLSKSGGGLNAGASDTVVVSFSASANSLVVNAYSDTVTFTNTTNGTGNTTRSVSLTVTNPPGALSVTPTAGITSTGHVGGTFSPASAMYTMSNTGGSPINWTITKTQTWVSVSKTSGTLDHGATDTTILSININANTLPAGSYSDTVTFTNTTNGAGNTTRAINLTVTVGDGPVTDASLKSPLEVNPVCATDVCAMHVCAAALEACRSCENPISHLSAQRSCENPFSHLPAHRSCENPFSHLPQRESFPASASAFAPQGRRAVATGGAMPYSASRNPWRKCV